MDGQRSFKFALAVVAVVTLACSRPASREEAAAPAGGEASKAPAASIPTNPLKEAYFGEQHLHTAYSLDAYIGGARLKPADAYRFARGEEVEVGGQKVRLRAPLDWAAVTDHAEYIGEMYSTMTEGAPGYDQDLLEQLRGLDTIEEREEWFLEYVVKSNRGSTPQPPPSTPASRPRSAAGRTTWPRPSRAPADPHNLVERGYAEGVPMGGTLEGSGEAPSFTVWAMKDADGAHLDRIQIIKGWVDARGEPQDAVFDVVWSGDRQPGNDGKVPAVGNTVDTGKATYTNTIGSAELMGTWTDPEFDPEQHALYYVRVLEIPTPRWSTYDAVRSGLPLQEGVPATIQERAWTSPIWYTP